MRRLLVVAIVVGVVAFFGLMYGGGRVDPSQWHGVTNSISPLPTN